MGRNVYSQGKRQREAEKARKKKEKAQRRAERREQGPEAEEIISVAEMVGDLPASHEVLREMELRAATPRAAAGVPCRLFVGSLSWETTTASLRAVFEKFGDVIDAVVMTDRNSGQSRGFGFVTFGNRRDAVRAIEKLDGAEVEGREISVSIATER